MAYNYLEENDLADALADSEDYMRPFLEQIPEIQRLTRGKPGKVPKGKPRVTDGTLAGIRREKPKQIIQQLPSGFSTIHGNDDLQAQANGVLKDVILEYANSGGTPYQKAKRAIRSTVDVGSAWAYCFFNRTGAMFHADYRLKHHGDILFEKGKVSEFDSNFMPMVEWLTEGDIKAIIWQESQRTLTTSEYDLNALQEVLDHGPGVKDEAAKTPEDKKANANNGYFKLVYFLQKGVDATFYVYAPSIKKCVRKWKTKDPRGIIPIHGLVPEDDDDNPLGEPLASISTGKQNLLDFDMQMYQYGQAYGYSPSLKKWGNTPSERIKLIPDNVIDMDGTPATDDFKPVDLATTATQNFGSNSGLIQTKIMTEMGHRSDTSVGAAAGNPQFSRTTAGVKQGQAVTDTSNNDLGVTYGEWQGRIFETCLNIQFAESKGKKDVPFKPDTVKRYKLEGKTNVDYDAKHGPISYKIEASSYRATDRDAETEKLSALMKTKSEMQSPDDKDMLMYNQIVRNTGVADPEKLLYTDDEIARAAEMRKQQTEIAHATILAQAQQLKQQNDAANNPQPEPAAPAPPPKTLGETISWKPGDLSASERAQALAQVGVQADSGGDDTPNAKQAEVDAAIKVDKHVHDTATNLSDHIIRHATPPPLPTDTHQSNPMEEPVNV